MTELYSRALERSQIETLNFNLETLVARTLEAGTPDALGVEAADPRFNRPRSGWYWQISGVEGGLFNLSNSLVGSEVPKLDVPFDARNSRSATADDVFGTRLRIVERKVTILDLEFVVSVTGNLDSIASQTGQFRGQTFIVLGAVGAMLAIMSALVGRVALRPVGKLARAIELVRSGNAKKVEGNYPLELTPLAEELNELLRSNTQIVERAKSQVGNLAHGLKTPLAVLRNEAEGKSKNLPLVVKSEVEKMNTQVKTYLDRAQMSARSAMIGSRTDTAKTVARLVRVVQKLHCERNVELILPQNETAWFHGDESDLEEMVGNLLDNACKWAKNKVVVSVDSSFNSEQKTVIITVNDDGDGLSEEEAISALKRGVRLDEKTAGSGLGLDIVKELVDIYGGSIVLEPGSHGGLRAILKLPSVK
ncbi:MAG: HAMP domain-containing histidine kinase [Devosiaceae bacterium]|nr:HAMP domain-containing histidine kinase [Devosiaceae bacterium]